MTGLFHHGFTDGIYGLRELFTRLHTLYAQSEVESLITHIGMNAQNTLTVNIEDNGNRRALWPVTLDFQRPVLQHRAETLLNSPVSLRIGEITFKT